VGIAGGAHGAHEGGSGDAAGLDATVEAGSDGNAEDGSSDTTSPLDGAADGARVDSAVADGGAADGSSDAMHDAASDSGDADAGAPCPTDLSNIGTGDFTVSFHMNTTLAGRLAVVNQRAICNTSNFWDVQILTSGGLQLETDDGPNHSIIVGSTVVNDGKDHDVLVKRVSQHVSISVDSKADPMGQGTSPVSFGALVPIATRTDVCTSAKTFVGTLDNVCASHP
jgi:hypothetical protein